MRWRPGWPAVSGRVPGGPNGRRMVGVTLVDRIGSGMWTTTSVLYFTYVAGLPLSRVGTLVALSNAVGVAGAPLGGRLADRLPITRLLIVLQLVRAVASVGLLSTQHYTALLVCASVSSFGDRASKVLTKLYAARVAGPDRVRYQAIDRTASNLGHALGGLGAAAALTAATTTVYRCILLADALSFVIAALLILRCAEISAPARANGGADGPHPAARSRGTPWRDGGYLAFVATEAVLFLDDAVFRVGLPLWVVHGTDATPRLVPLLMVLNNVLVVLFQVPLSRFGTTASAARRLLLPLGGIFLLGGAAMALSAVGGAVWATVALTVATASFAFAEIVHATTSWELSIALAPQHAQGAYVGVHGLAQAVQRATGPLVVSVAIATGPVGWSAFGVAIAGTGLAQRRLIRGRLARLAAKPVASPPESAAEPGPAALSAADPLTRPSR